MSDSWYFFYQPTAKASWSVALASERDRINKELKPELNTILDVNSSIETTMDFEAKSKLKYRGDMYLDFDSEDIADVIVHFQECLTLLKSKGTNLNALKIYCSGGKGFHIEMPASMLMAKIPPHGIQALPLIYKELAYRLAVPTLDLRVYSQGKGRQWRQPNIKRANGNYKVQITADEAFEMSAERYAELVKHPRPLFPVEEASFTPDLALLYAKARDTVTDGLTQRKKKKSADQTLERFKGAWPETLKTILAGQGLKENIGWNYLCIQVAATACELNKTEDQMVEDARGLLETYQGDGKRYGSPKLREAELRKMHRYFTESPTYAFSVGGILSLVDPETRNATDLKDGDFIADPLEEKPEATAEGEEGEDVEDESTQVRVNRNGMWSRTEHGWKRISDFGFANATLLKLPPPNNKIIGYDVEGFIRSKGAGALTLTINDLASKAAMHNLLLRELSTAFKGTDMDSAHIIDYLRNKTVSQSKISLVTQVEGVDLIATPDAKTEDDVELIWSSPRGVISTGPNNYVFKPAITGAATFNSDLWEAPALCSDDAQMIADLLNINTPQNLARMLGWYSATFLCPVFRKYYNQFPLMQVYGGASAGKSKTIALLSHLHYHIKPPKISSASQLTPFALIAIVAASSSIPLVLEELRPRLMTQDKYNNSVNVLKSSYDGHDVSRGGIGAKGEGAVVNNYACTAPILYIAEEKNGEVALQERTVSVCLSEMDRYGRSAPYDRLLSRKSRLGRIGKSMLLNTLSLDIPKFKEDFDSIVQGIRDEMGPARDGKDRPIFNLATVLFGLNFMQLAIKESCGSDFDSQFDLMRNSLRDNVVEFVPHNMSEASRVIDTMAQMSKVLDVQYKLELGREYTPSPDGVNIDIKLKPAYAKYMRYVRSLGMPPLYDSDQAFIAAMSRYSGVISKACVDNPRLFGGPSEPVYRFSVAHLTKEQVETFKV